MAADTRSTHTDALATLGMLHTQQEHRDAIHLGVEAVVAGDDLRPGQHIGFMDDGRVSFRAAKKIGIVDPFLQRPLNEGDRFWLIVYPRQITSLRHVWEHPDFPNSQETSHG